MRAAARLGAMGALGVATFTALAMGLAGCSKPAAPPVAPNPPPPPNAAPLPQGWLWPPGAGQKASLRAQPGVVRPIDAARLRSARPGAGCRPIEVVPGFFVMPPCAPLPSFFSSMSVHRQRTQVPLPFSVDLRATGYDGPVKDQQQVGVCWSFAISTLMDNAVRRAAKNDVVAPLHILAADAFSTLHTTGKTDRAIALEPTWTYDPVKACKLNEEPSEVWCEDAYHVRHGSWREDPMLVGEVNRANASGVYRITKMETLNDPSNPEEYAEILAGGQAIYGSFEIDDQAWTRAQGGIITDYPMGTRGRHAVAVVGYRVGRGRELLVHNSWGTTWGDGGYAWVSEATVRAHAKDAWIIEVDAGMPNPLPGGLPGINLPFPMPAGFPTALPPGLPASIPTTFPFPLPGQPQQQPSGASCPVRDLVFGSCAAACPSGAPPAAGLCGPGAPASGGGAQCASGQVMDWASGQCVAQCANGLPPIAGHCL